MLALYAIGDTCSISSTSLFCPELPAPAMLCLPLISSTLSSSSVLSSVLCLLPGFPLRSLPLTQTQWFLFCFISLSTCWGSLLPPVIVFRYLPYSSDFRYSIYLSTTPFRLSYCSKTDSISPSSLSRLSSSCCVQALQLTGAVLPSDSPPFRYLSWRCLFEGNFGGSGGGWGAQRKDWAGWGGVDRVGGQAGSISSWTVCLWRCRMASYLRMRSSLLCQALELALLTALMLTLQCWHLGAHYIQTRMKSHHLRAIKVPEFGEEDMDVAKSRDGKGEQDEATVKERLSGLINHDGYKIAMAVLTLYSIFAIDVQKSFFEQPAAYVFGYVHIVCICLFAVEIVFNWVATQEYRLSFYFWIDIISTASMVLEITWIDNWLALNSRLPGVFTIAKVVKASRLSRIGGRAAKIILMFLRYLKEKKAQQEEETRKREQKLTEEAVGDSFYKTRTQIESNYPEEEDFDENEARDGVEELAPEHREQQELKPPGVGRGLDIISEEDVTDRSEAESNSDNGPTFSKLRKESAHFLKRRSKLEQPQVKTMGKKVPRKVFEVSNIVERLQQTFKLTAIEQRRVDPVRKREIERQWQELCEREEEMRLQEKEKIKSNKENFKLGETLKERIQKNIIIMIMSLIIILPLISADTWFDRDPTIDQLMDTYAAVAARLNSTHTQRAFVEHMVTASRSTTSPIIDLALATGQGTYAYPGADFAGIGQPEYSHELLTEPEKIRAEGGGLRVIFSDRYIQQIVANINIFRSLFIVILLIFSTIIFMYSIESNALVPLENMCKTINKISINPFEALKEINQKKEKEPEPPGEDEQRAGELETNVLEKVIWRMTNLLVIGAGEIGSELISAKNEPGAGGGESKTNLVEGCKIHGVFMCVQLANYGRVAESYGSELPAFINRITAQVNEFAVKNGGEILENDPPYYLLFWKTPEDLNLEMENTKFFIADNPLKNMGKTVETQKIAQLALRTYLQISLALSDFNKRRLDNSSFHAPDRFDEELEYFVLQAGLHLGDAFQGSIGNTLKVEVKCVSSDVSHAKKLCRLAGHYGVSNLLSSELCELMVDMEGSRIRKVDYVREREGGSEYWLYMCDFSLLPIIEPAKFSSKQGRRKRKSRGSPLRRQASEETGLAYRKRSELLHQLKTDSLEAVMPLTMPEKLSQTMFTLNFYESWGEALEEYYAGEWENARVLFEVMGDYYPATVKDIMATVMLGRMERAGWQVPPDWSKAYTLTLY